MPLIESSRSKNILHENTSEENLLNGVTEESHDVQKENRKNEVIYYKPYCICVVSFKLGISIDKFE